LSYRPAGDVFKDPSLRFGKWIYHSLRNDIMGAFRSCSSATLHQSGSEDPHYVYLQLVAFCIWSTGLYSGIEE
jgi:hypothetical protein